MAPSEIGEAFLEHFLLPLVRGGRVQVGWPLGQPELDRLRSAVPPGGSPQGAAFAAVETARQARAAALWLYPVPLLWDEPSARLAAAAHNLLFLSHPEAQGFTVRGARLLQVAHFTSGLLKLEPPRSGCEAVARHTLVANLFELSREDVVLDTLLMVYEFRGQEPPARLRRLPGLRRVRETRSRVRWIDEESLSEEQLLLLRGLLRASPLTDLLTPLRPRPSFAWYELHPYLGWPGLARLVCQCYLEMGLLRVGGPLVRAFWELAEGPPSAGRRTAVRRVLGLLLFLCAAANLRAPASLGEVGRDLLAELPTLLAVAASCGLLSGAVDEPLRQHLEQRAAEHGQTLGTHAVNQLAARLRAALE